MALSSFQAWQTCRCLPVSLLPLLSLSSRFLCLCLSFTSSLLSFHFSPSVLLSASSEFAAGDSAADLSMCPQEPHPFRTNRSESFINRTHAERGSLHQRREKQRWDSSVNHYLPVGSFHCERLLFQVKLILCYNLFRKAPRYVHRLQIH